MDSPIPEEPQVVLEDLREPLNFLLLLGGDLDTGQKARSLVGVNDCVPTLVCWRPCRPEGKPLEPQSEADVSQQLQAFSFEPLCPGSGCVQARAVGKQRHPDGRQCRAEERIAQGRMVQTGTCRELWARLPANDRGIIYRLATIQE